MLLSQRLKVVCVYSSPLIKGRIEIYRYASHTGAENEDQKSKDQEEQ